MSSCAATPARAMRWAARRRSLRLTMPTIKPYAEVGQRQRVAGIRRQMYQVVLESPLSPLLSLLS